MKNKYLLLLISIFFLTSFNSKAQDFWEVVSTPDSANLVSIFIHSNGDIFIGSNGVYLSEDNGQTWDYIGLYGETIYSLITDSSNNIFAGGNGGIFKSNDYGESWYVVFEGLNNVLSFATGTEGLMFAGSGYDIGIIRSFDFGETWDTVFYVPGWEEYVFDITISPDGMLYAGTTAWLGNGGGVYRSLNNGDTWEHVGLLYYYIQSLAVNTNGDLFAGSVGHHYQGIAGILISSDLGDSWTMLKDNEIVIGIEINTEGYIYIGCSNDWTSGGAYYSTDYGISWQPIHSGLIVKDIDRLSLSANQYLYAISYSTNTFYRSCEPTVTIFNPPNIRKINFKAYPNPFYSEIFIEIEFPLLINSDIISGLYTVKGEKIREYNIQYLYNGFARIKIDGNDLLQGIYYYIIESDRFRECIKIIKLNDI